MHLRVISSSLSREHRRVGIKFDWRVDENATKQLNRDRSLLDDP